MVTNIAHRSHVWCVGGGSVGEVSGYNYNYPAECCDSVTRPLWPVLLTLQPHIHTQHYRATGHNCVR